MKGFTMKMSIEEAWDAAELPPADTWPGLSQAEREYRAQVLDGIALRVAEDGVRVSAPDPDRGKLFMPFAALKGYDGVIAEVEREAAERDEF